MSRYDADVDESSLQELAYTLFCAYCGPHASSSIKASIKEQLQVPTSHAMCLMALLIQTL